MGKFEMAQAAITAQMMASLGAAEMLKGVGPEILTFDMTADVIESAIAERGGAKGVLLSLELLALFRAAAQLVGAANALLDMSAEIAEEEKGKNESS